MNDVQEKGKKNKKEREKEIKKEEKSVSSRPCGLSTRNVLQLLINLS